MFALLSKTVACTLPIALMLTMSYLRRPMTKQRLLSLLPFFMLGLGLALYTVHVEKTNVGAVGDEFAFTFAERLLIATRALLFYPAKLLVPTSLTFIYPRWEINAASLVAYWSVLVVAILVAAIMLAYWRRIRGPALALTYYSITIFPALGFISFYPMRYSFVADHFQYLASLGVIALVVSSAATALHSSRIATALTVPVLGGLAIFTWYQCHMYKDQQTLWTWTAEEIPKAWIAQNNLGLLLADQGHYELAEKRFRAALQTKPDLYEVHGNLGGVLVGQGRLGEALEHFQLAVEHAKQFEEQILPFLQAGDRPRISARLRLQTAQVLELLERDAEAEKWYRSALDTEPNNADLRLYLAKYLIEHGNAPEAIRHVERILESQTQHFEALILLGDAYRAQRRFAEAHLHYRLAGAAAEKPADRIRATGTLARFLATCPDDKLRNGEEAVALAEQLNTVLQGQDPVMLDTLAAAYAEVGRYDNAVRTAEEALGLARELGLQDLAQQIEQRLGAYRARQPWRQ